MTTDARQSINLDVTGMTCASCAARIEKKLSKMDGVQASVNYATNKALVLAPQSVSVDDLIATVEKAGYGASVPEPDAPEPPDPARLLLRRLVVAAVLAVPVMAMAMVPAWQFPGWQWLSLVLATPVVFWAGWSFHRSALVNLRHGATTMDTLISMGTLAAYGWSLYALLFGHAGMIGFTHPFELRLMRDHAGGAIYFEAAVGIITFLLLGRWFEARSRRDAGSAIRALYSLGAKDVLVPRESGTARIPIDQLGVGDVFIVAPGEKVATDGTVVEGRSAVDAALITGESVPIEVEPGSAVIGATVNTTGRLFVRATRVGSDTQLAQMARLVEQAQTGKAPVQRLADRISGVFVPIVLGLALVTLVAWLIAGAGINFALTAAVAVLIIACPCALGLATPTALLVGTGRGAELGIVIRGPQILEQTRTVDTIVLDKTGTLTTGTMTVASVTAVGDEATLRRYAAALEAASEHPVAKAVAGLDAHPLSVSDVTAVPGQGVSGTVDGHRVLAGNRALLGGLDVPASLLDASSAAADRGESLVWIAWDDAVRGLVTVSDTPKPTAAQAVAAYRTLGLTPVLLSGDHRSAAEHTAALVGVDTVLSEVSPSQKVDAVTRLQDEGRVVAMVGDGVNDAAALAQADLGISMGSGTDAAMAASDLTLMHSDPLAAADAIRLSRATLRTIKVNLFWAFAYNVAAIPIAALGYLNPMFASLAMAFSSVFVVSNSLRLRRFAPLTRVLSPH